MTHVRLPSWDQMHLVEIVAAFEIDAVVVSASIGAGADAVVEELVLAEATVAFAAFHLLMAH